MTAWRPERPKTAKGPAPPAWASRCLCLRDRAWQVAIPDSRRFLFSFPVGRKNRLGNHQAGADPVSRLRTGRGFRRAAIGRDGRWPHWRQGQAGHSRWPKAARSRMMAVRTSARWGQVGLADDRRWVHRSNPSPDRHSGGGWLFQGRVVIRRLGPGRVSSAVLQNLVRWLQYARRSSLFRQLR